MFVAKGYWDLSEVKGKASSLDSPVFAVLAPDTLGQIRAEMIP